MTYLELVKEALLEAGVREDVDSVTTLVGATGIVADFARWVKRQWEHMQVVDNSHHWWFRKALDQTLALSAGDDDYAMPSGLKTIDTESMTVYTTAKTDETRVYEMDYLDWRTRYDTVTGVQGRPLYLIIRPDNVLQVYPVPDQAYTLRFDGVRDKQTLSANTDEPYLPEEYHMAIAHGAAMRYAMAHEDSTKYAEQESYYRPYWDEIVEKQTGPVRVKLGHLHVNARRYGSY